MQYIFTVSILVSVLFLGGCGSSNADFSNESAEVVDNYSYKIDSLIQNTLPRQFNGVVHISQKGETKYSKTSGYSNIEDSIPFTISDNFRIQSNSKQITAALVLKEVEKGSIELEKTIKEYLANFTQTWADSVTIHQLLNMSSGIIGLDEPLLFTPGEGYRYSNPGYGLLGRILENVTGKKYVELANNLFASLSMTNTYCYELGSYSKGIVKSYWIIDKELKSADFDDSGYTEQEWADFTPAGGVISNVDDLLIWDTKLHSGQLLSSEHYNLMTTPSNKGPHAAFDKETIGYGYGLRMHDKPLVHIGHGGRGFGFVCLKFYIPETKVDVIVWENLYSRDPDFMAGDIVYYFENEIRRIVLKSSLVD